MTMVLIPKSTEEQFINQSSRQNNDELEKWTAERMDQLAARIGEGEPQEVAEPPDMTLANNEAIQMIVATTNKIALVTCQPGRLWRRGLPATKRVILKIL